MCCLPGVQLKEGKRYLRLYVVPVRVDGQLWGQEIHKVSLTVPPVLYPQRLCVLFIKPTKRKLWDNLEQETNLGIPRGTALSSLITEKM